MTRRNPLCPPANEDILTCSCCGAGLRDSAKENVSFGWVPYPHDQGYGMCRDCGGDPEAKTRKKKMGWAAATFFEARFEVLQQSLSEENRAKFSAMSYERKCAVVAGLVQKGVII